MSSEPQINKDITHENILNVFEDACEQENVPQIQYLMTVDAADKINNQFNINLGFALACSTGSINVAKYLLTSNTLKNNADLKYDSEVGLNWACRGGHIELVRYLLTDKSLKYNGNIHIDDDACLRWACLEGQLDVVKYLLTSPELKEHADIHAHCDTSFLWALQNKHTHILQYFIFDLNIEKTQHIFNHLLENPNPQIEHWFNLRDLNKQLDKNLSKTKITKKAKL